MEVVNLVFAILGHVLASMLYVARRLRLPSGSSVPKAVVDRSSILEHKEEIIELWEKKMASEQPLECPKKEEEESVVIQAKELQNGTAHKMTNGNILKNEEKDINENISVETHLPEPLDANKTDETKLQKVILKDEVEHTNEGEILVSIDTEAESEMAEMQNEEMLVETEVVEVQEKVVMTLQQTVVTTVKKETTVVEEREMTLSEEVLKEDSQDDFEEMERKIEAEESLAADAEIMAKIQMTEDFDEEFSKGDTLKMHETTKEVDLEDIPDPVDSPDSLETIEIPDGDDFEHYTVLDPRSKTNEEMMNGNSTQDSYFPTGNGYVAEDSVILAMDKKVVERNSQNGEMEEKTFDDHFVLDTREAISPLGDEDKRDSTGKKLRIHTLGVQKTEQPYSTCTTETKIAMEIREMREREEELKTMRERQAQLSPVPPSPQQKKAPTTNKVIPLQKAPPPAPYVMANNQKAISTPGYRVSSVFGTRSLSQQAKDESKFNRNFNKETTVEKEIRLAKDREEELRKQKGLPPREDDSYVKPSQVKSSQAKAFGKMANAENSRLIATAKIQHEIQEQTMREIALRESGHIQTLSSERTDSKVTKLKTLDLASPECVSPTFQNGNGHSNGLFLNGHMSPDSISPKRSTPSPTGSNYSIPYGLPRNVVSPNNNSGNKNISMQKFIASRGKETTFTSPRNNGPFHQKADYQDGTTRSIPEPGKLKRSASVESKIQQEILEMKLREEELKSLHSGRDIDTSNGDYGDMIPKSPIEYRHNGDEMEEMCPRRSNLIAQWEQRIQKSEGKA